LPAIYKFKFSNVLESAKQANKHVFIQSCNQGCAGEALGSSTRPCPSHRTICGQYILNIASLNADLCDGIFFSDHSNLQVPEDDGVYEELSEDEFAERVQDLRNDDFVVGDDGKSHLRHPSHSP
jgi:hypothetical protein